MWYIAAPAARDSASATSATVDCREHGARRVGGVGEDTCRACPTGPSSSSTSSSTVISRGGTGERVAALDPALGAQDPGAPQRGEQLLEELHRDLAPARELSDRHRPAVALVVQLDERAQRIRRLRA